MDGTWTLAVPEREETVGDDATHRLGRLFDAHHRRLFTLACRMTGDREDARDLVQETFVRAAGARALPENGSGAEAWLETSASNGMENERVWPAGIVCVR